MRSPSPNMLVDGQACGRCEAPLWLTPKAVVVTFADDPDYAHVELRCEFCTQWLRLKPISYVDEAREMGCGFREEPGGLSDELHDAYERVMNPVSDEIVPNVLIEEVMCPKCKGPLWVTPGAIIVTYAVAAGYAHVEVVCDFCQGGVRLSPGAYVAEAQALACERRRRTGIVPIKLRRQYYRVTGCELVVVNPLTRSERKQVATFARHLRALPSATDPFSADGMDPGHFQATDAA